MAGTDGVAPIVPDELDDTDQRVDQVSLDAMEQLHPQEDA